ncbi:DUF444 family protein [Trichloromonas sp.]|uniref:DUF444 family protein n=1 Tax=Trichloromonas sp. TaxID=3069249 RepID=UPI003D815EA7
MNPKLKDFFNSIKAQGLSAERERQLLQELHSGCDHGLVPPPAGPLHRLGDIFAQLYGVSDLCAMQKMESGQGAYTTNIRSLDELLERDKQREKDGFPRKIRVGRMIKPGRGDDDKVVVVPTTVEEKFIHDPTFKPPEKGDSTGGSGDGEEGEVIGEQPLRPEPGAGTGEAGQGEGGEHEVESSAYDLGRILSDKFELPNLKEKGKKRSLTRYTYDLTDKNRGFGQVLDKKATLRSVLETNIGLGNVPDFNDIDTSRFLITPRDKVYRVLSKEKDYESQAMIFFLRDYSGSMAGKATDIVVTQHVLIYSWLLFQYERQVETRFILHDTEAREVSDFYTYYNSKVAGGTKVAVAYQMVNEIVDKENLAKDYNIYVFHGTDGDDWDSSGTDALPELEKMLKYASRVGVSIAEHVGSMSNAGNTEVQRYLNQSGLLEKHPDLLRLDVMGEDADEPRLIEGIKTLIS